MSGISRGKVKNPKIPGGFQKSISSTPPVCFFSGIAQWHSAEKWEEESTSKLQGHKGCTCLSEMWLNSCSFNLSLVISWTSPCQVHPKLVNQNFLILSSFFTKYFLRPWNSYFQKKILIIFINYMDFFCVYKRVLGVALWTVTVNL